MTEYAPPPSSEEAIEELEGLSSLSDDEFEALLTEAAMTAPEPEPEPEFISVGELLLLNVETRIGRIADALETANKIKKAGADNIEALTQQVHRLADALDSISSVLRCVTESVESDADGVTRCYLRTRDDNHGFFLSQRNGD